MDPLVTTFLFFFGGLAFVVGMLALIKSGEDADPQRKNRGPDVDRLAVQWARSKGYAVPENPDGCLWSIGVLIGLMAAVVPGLALLGWLFLKKRDYEREIRQIRNKWIDAGKPAPLPPAD